MNRKAIGLVTPAVATAPDYFSGFDVATQTL